MAFRAFPYADVLGYSAFHVVPALRAEARGRLESSDMPNLPALLLRLMFEFHHEP